MGLAPSCLSNHQAELLTAHFPNWVLVLSISCGSTSGKFIKIHSERKKECPINLFKVQGCTLNFFNIQVLLTMSNHWVRWLQTFWQISTWSCIYWNLTLPSLLIFCILAKFCPQICTQGSSWFPFKGFCKTSPYLRVREALPVSEDDARQLKFSRRDGLNGLWLDWKHVYISF